MGIGISIFFVAVGAILAFALEVEETTGFRVDTIGVDVNLNTIGVILMIIGGLGLLLALTVFGGRGGSRGGMIVD